MTKSITDIVLLESEKNLEKLRAVLTEYNFEVYSVLPQFPGADDQVSTRVKLFPDVLSRDLEARKNFVWFVHNYTVVPIHLAMRSRLPVYENWIQMVMPKHDRKLVLADFVTALKPLGFDISDMDYYVLDTLTSNRYTLRCKDNNPRFKGGVQIATVEAIHADAKPDVSMYLDWDFQMTDNQFLIHHRNFLTYSFCFTKENAMVIKCINDPDDPNIADAVVQIDIMAHYVEGIGLTKPKIRKHLTKFRVERKLPAQIYKEAGVETSLPLGMMGDYRTSWDLIDRINELYELGITKMDVIDLNIHDNLHGFRFKSSCLGYVGEIVVDIKGRVGKNKS